jgi:hypothetical protein
LFSPILVALDIVLNNTKRKKLKKNQAQPPQFKDGHLTAVWTRDVCDFLDTSSENAVSTYNQPNLESRIIVAFCVQSFDLSIQYLSL